MYIDPILKELASAPLVSYEEAVRLFHCRHRQSPAEKDIMLAGRYFFDLVQNLGFEPAVENMMETYERSYGIDPMVETAWFQLAADFVGYYYQL